MPIAIPMSAFLSAGASFTHRRSSPPRSDSEAQSPRAACAPATRAHTRRSNRPHARVAHRRSLPARTINNTPSLHNPNSSAIAFAVSGWSPVIMMTLIPASSHLRTAAFASDAADRSFRRDQATSYRFQHLSRRARFISHGQNAQRLAAICRARSSILSGALHRAFPLLHPSTAKRTTARSLRARLSSTRRHRAFGAASSFASSRR